MPCAVKIEVVQYIRSQKSIKARRDLVNAKLWMDPISLPC